MDHEDRRSGGLFPSADEDARRAEKGGVDTPQTRAAAYRLAFTDRDFLFSEELRGMRLALELQKTETILRDNDIRSTVVVFGSARTPPPEDTSAPPVSGALDRRRAYDEARKFARIASIAGQSEQSVGRRFVVVTGGGPGVMEAANRGADDVDARSIGLNITLAHEQAPNAYVTPELCFQFHYFAVRKMHFLMRALAVVCFPGGFGTMDELFETLTLIQTGKAQRVPVLLFDKKFWTTVVNFEALVEAGVISPKDLELFTYVESAREAWDAICDWHKLDAERQAGADDA